MAEYVTLLDCVRDRVGISEDICDYDEDIRLYIRDALADMRDSGCPSSLLPSTEDAEDAPVAVTDERVLTAVSCYVMAYLGTDRSDTNRYLDLYRKKVFRLALNEEDI